MISLQGPDLRDGRGSRQGLGKRCRAVFCLARSRLISRKDHGERGALANFALDCDGSTVCQGDCSNEAQAKAEASLGATAIGSVKTIPDSCLFLSGNAAPFILDPDLDGFRITDGGDPDFALLAVVLDGVVDEVGE